MKILIIEDDCRKADAVVQLLSSNTPELVARVEQSYQSGLRAAIEWNPDLMILDMSLPNYDAGPGQRSGKPRPLGGFEIMRKLRRKGVAARAIVLTQLDHFGDNGHEYDFDALEKKCRDEFPESFRGSIYFAQSSASWMSQLLEAIEEARVAI